MNRVRFTLCLLAIVLFAGPMTAQLQNCGLPAGSGGTISAAGGTVAPGSLSPAPALTGESAGLSFVQYLFLNPNDLVLDTLSGQTGPRIIFANNTGQADPAADLGLSVGDEFCVMSMSFSLDILQRQVDTLYTSSFFGVPCCDFAEVTQGVDVCSLMVDAGIVNGSDLADYNDLADFALAYGIQASLESIFFLVDSFINIVPPGSPCTAGAPMCYATSNQICYLVDTATGLLGSQIWETNLALAPNPAHQAVRMTFTSRLAGEATLQLVDVTGRLRQTQRLAMVAGENRLTVALDGLAAGLYAVYLDGPEGRASARLVVE